MQNKYSGDEGENSGCEEELEQSEKQTNKTHLTKHSVAATSYSKVLPVQAYITARDSKLWY